MASTSAATGTEWSPEGGIKKSQLLTKCIHDRGTRLTVICLVLGLLMLISVVALFVIAIYLDMHPRLPHIIVQNASIAELTMRTDEASGMPYVSVFMSLTMVSRSRYRIPYRFSASSLQLVFETVQPVGTVETPAFDQGRQENATFATTVLQKTFVGSQFVADLRNAIDVGRVRLSLVGHIPAKFRASRARVGRLQAPVNCTLDVRPVQSLAPTSVSSSKPRSAPSSSHNCTTNGHCSSHAVVQHQFEENLLYVDCQEFESLRW